MTKEEELQLVIEAKTNMQAFAKIYDYYTPKLLAYILNRIPRKESAEDIVSIVWHKAISGIQKFDTKKDVRFGSWLYKTTHSTFIDMLRKEKRIVSFLEYSDSPSYGLSDISSEIIKKETQRIQIASTLKDINERYQEIISLTYFADYTIDELSVHFGMKSTQVSVLLHRATKAFQKEFIKKFPESEIFI